MARGVTLMSVFSALSQTPAYTTRPRIRGYILHRTVCLFTPQPSVVLIQLQRDGQAELIWMAG